MLLLIPFKVVIKMVLNLEPMTVFGSHSSVFHLTDAIYVYASTQTSIYFVYALVVLLLLVVLHINIQPFKKTAVTWYTSIDPVFLLLTSVIYTSVIGTDVGSMLEHAYLSAMVILGLLMMIIYITFLLLHWIYS